jgi:hypothetical protein
MIERDRPSLLRSVLARLRRLFDAPSDSGGGSTGTCHLCGERRDDLGEDDLCRPCAMAGW